MRETMNILSLGKLTLVALKKEITAMDNCALL
jgi:hypothetical protein